MSITLVNRSFSGGSLDNVPFAIAPTSPGNSLVIALSIFGRGLGAISCTTNAGDSVPNLPMQSNNPLFPAFDDDGSFDNTQILLISSGLGGATQMTIHCGANFNAWVYELDAGGGIQIADASFTNLITHTTTATGPTISSTEPAFYVACMTSGPATAIAGPWTFDQVDTSMGGVVTLSFGAGFLNSAGSQQPVFTQGIANQWSVSAAAFTGLSAPTAKLYVISKLSPDQPFDEHVGTNGLITDQAINSTYCTYGFVNSAKAAQNPLLGFHRKRFSGIQSNIRGSGQLLINTFPNYIVQQNLQYNPYAQPLPPIVLQTDPPDDIVRPLNTGGNRVFVMYSTNAVGAAFRLSKLILVGVMDTFTITNPNSG